MVMESWQRCCQNRGELTQSKLSSEITKAGKKGGEPAAVGTGECTQGRQCRGQERLIGVCHSTRALANDGINIFRMVSKREKSILPKDPLRSRMACLAEKTGEEPLLSLLTKTWMCYRTEQPYQPGTPLLE